MQRPGLALAAFLLLAAMRALWRAEVEGGR